jgi:hypothetical protein
MLQSPFCFITSIHPASMPMANFTDALQEKKVYELNHVIVTHAADQQSRMVWFTVVYMYYILSKQRNSLLKISIAA